MEIYTNSNVCCVHVEKYINVGVQKVHGRNVARVSHVDHFHCVCVCVCEYANMYVFITIHVCICAHMEVYTNAHVCM